MEERLVCAIERIDKNIGQIAETLSKPQSKFKSVLELITLIVASLTIIGVAEAFMNLIRGFKQ